MLKCFGVIGKYMSGVSLPEDKSDLVTSSDFRELLESQVEEIKEFVERNEEDDVWEYGEFEMFDGVYFVMDWETEGLRDTYVLVDLDEVGDWYVSPDGPDVTRCDTEVVRVSKKVAWAMAVFRDDVVVHDPLSKTDEDVEITVEIDYSDRSGPRFLTKLLRSLRVVEGVPEVLEYSESNSREDVDMWV